MVMSLSEYLAQIAEHLAQEVRPVLGIKQLTKNPVLLGAYAEATVRRLARKVVSPMRVSTGAVLDHPTPDPLKQLDLVIWAPFPAPALFEVEDFALVPRSSAFGAIEIKRSNYVRVDKSLEEFLTSIEQAPILAEPDEKIGDLRPAVLGVIPVLEEPASGRLKKLLGDQRVVALFQRENQAVKVRSQDVLGLINFLHYVTWRYHSRLGRPEYPQINAVMAASRDPA